MHLNGQQFKNMIIHGAIGVIDTQEELNKINVFPVPDGDTGSNMSAAFESIYNDLINTDTTSVSQIALIAADAALNGSRGNSGAILAQFFEGLSKGLSNHETIGISDFTKAAKQATQLAISAIEKPIEGTIITIMREWSHSLAQHLPNAKNFQELIKASYDDADSALKQTPLQLEVLSKNHVVDAGAQGFVYFVSGMYKGLKEEKPYTPQPNNTEEKTNTLEEKPHYDTTHHEMHLDRHAMHTQDINYQFCTECIVHGSDLDLDEVRQKLRTWGDSLVVVGNSRKVKIHIHTNAPNKVFRQANYFGDVLETKADDMWAQYRANIGWKLNKRIALITDTSASIPQDFIVKYNIMLIPLQVIVNNKSHLDRVNLSNTEFMKHLNDDKNTITTSQPTMSDIKSAFDHALNQSALVVGIFLSSGVSGTFQTIKQIAKQFEGEEIYLFDSLSFTGGLGLVVMNAAKTIQKNLSLSVIKQKIEADIRESKTFVTLATMKHAVRGGRVKKSSAWIARLLHLYPILTVNNTGKAEKCSVGFSFKGTLYLMLKKAIKAAKECRGTPQFMVTHADRLATAQDIAKKLKKVFPQSEIIIQETTPVLASHSGPGAVAISVNSEA